MSAQPGSDAISAFSLLMELRQLRAEVAVLDVREECRFAAGHILVASSLPLSRLELQIARLVPRSTCRIVLYDDDDGLARTAAVRLRQFGYGDLVQIRHGMPGWTAAGGEVFQGLNTPSKALGVHAQCELAIPEVGPEQLAGILKGRQGALVIDCRPYTEYQRGCIPGAVNCPGVEILKHLPELETTDMAFINCAGRTRGLLAARTLADFGFRGSAVALRDGTMGWELAGHSLEKGAKRTLTDTVDIRPHTRAVAEDIRRQFGILLVDGETLARLRADHDRTTYLFDIRQASEYQAGHIPGARHVAGGQLVQNLDQHVATLGARIVLSDHDGVRATSVALWLRRMGWRDVAVAAVSDGSHGLEVGLEREVAMNIPDTSYLSAPELKVLLDRGNVVVADLATSRGYRSGHIPDAWFIVRSRLGTMLGSLPKAETFILTSEDGILAAFASKDDFPFEGAVRVLNGGTESWRRAGYPLSRSLDRLIDEMDDVVLKPSELSEGREAAMRDYLSGSEGLLDKVRRDGTLRLAALPIRGETCHGIMDTRS